MTEEMKVDDGGLRQKTVRVNYPSNSKASTGVPQKPLLDRPPNEKIITGKVHQKRKPIVSQIGKSMLAENGESVLEYLILEVLVPAAKDTIIDAVSQGIQRIFYGDSRPRGSSGRTVHTSYNKISKPSGYEQRKDISRQDRASHNFDDILLESRGEAEEVLDRLRDIIRDYESAKITDLYDLVGITGSFTDEQVGLDRPANGSCQAKTFEAVIFSSYPEPNLWTYDS